LLLYLLKKRKIAWSSKLSTWLSDFETTPLLALPVDSAFLLMLAFASEENENIFFINKNALKRI
jgi:hypothetical protein